MKKQRTVTVAMFAYQNPNFRDATIFGSQDTVDVLRQWESCPKCRRGAIVNLEVPLPKAKARKNT